MDLSAEHKNLLLDLAFFCPFEQFLDIELRPLSIGTYKFLQMVDSPFLDGSVELTGLAETQQVSLYIWLHTAPLRDVCSALWSGDWLHYINEQKEANYDVVDLFRPYRARLIGLLEACSFRVRPKPRIPNDPTPKDVVPASEMAFRLAKIMQHTGLSRDYVMWELWLPEAEQYYHDALHWNGAWTIAAEKEINALELEDNIPDWMRVEIDKRSNADERGDAEPE